MSDQRLREAVRRARETGLPADRDRVLLERVRAGVHVKPIEGGSAAALVLLAIEREAAPLTACLTAGRTDNTTAAPGPRRPRRLHRRKGAATCAVVLVDADVESVKAHPDGRPGLVAVVVYRHVGGPALTVDGVTFYRHGVPVVHRSHRPVVVMEGDLMRTTYTLDGARCWAPEAT